MRRAEIAAVTLALALAVAAPAAADPPAAAPPVRVWEASETIPTYEEGPPDVNAPFDLFTSSRFNYPYTLRENLTDRRAPRTWRTLNLENEQLRVSVLPDLGGRLWRCVDKANGASMFYANPSLKFAQVAYRGAWATFGIEWNFPVSHNWVTSSPVDFATVTHEDGSASIVVGNIDLVYGMQWRVELLLRPGRAVLEQATTLYNRSDLRHRFYWWTNAAVEAWDDSVLVYPMAFTASHGFTQVDTWPVSTAGVDLRRPGNHREGPVSLFSHGSREPFMGVYHPRLRAGVAHWADPAALPSKKVWSWGADADGRDWRKALSDNESAEVEIQAGLFRNQETYGFLGPQETVRFRGGKVAVVISELVDGVKLSEFLANQPRKRLRTFEALHVLHTLARGIAPIHARGEYHGDIHDDNIMIRRSGISFDVKLVDFFDLGRPNRSKIHKDVLNLIEVFHTIVGGRDHYAAQPRVVKNIIRGLRDTLILARFKSAGDIQRHLETLQWE
jgi:tRNA A-37 threonylcarbamoyl transferase component Bud32